MGLVVSCLCPGLFRLFVATLYHQLYPLGKNSRVQPHPENRLFGVMPRLKRRQINGRGNICLGGRSWPPAHLLIGRSSSVPNPLPPAAGDPGQDLAFESAPYIVTQKGTRYVRGTFQKSASVSGPGPHSLSPWLSSVRIVPTAKADFEALSNKGR